MLESLNNILVPELLDSISKIIVDARKRVVQIINNELIGTYWKIGKEIVEKEQINNKHKRNFYLAYPMRLKRLILILAVTIFAYSTVYSSEQIPDRLIIGKDTIYLKTFPLEYLHFKHRELKAPFDYGGYPFPHTACYRGYVATWQIIDETLILKEVEKIDSLGTQLNIIEYFTNSVYTPKTLNGYVVADWYSDTLKLYDFFRYNFAYKRNEFYVSRDFSGEKDKRIELVFEKGKLVKNDIIPIETYLIGDTLGLDVYYYQNWLVGYKPVYVQGIVRENNGKKVLLEIFSLGTDKKSIKRKLQKEIYIGYVWVNPRYCKKNQKTFINFQQKTQ